MVEYVCTIIDVTTRAKAVPAIRRCLKTALNRSRMWTGWPLPTAGIASEPLVSGGTIPARISWVSNMNVSLLDRYMQPGDGLLHGFASGAIAVTPAEAAVAATADAALPKKPVNQGTLLLVRTKVATVSPGATEKVWPTAMIFPASVTSSTR